MESRRYRTVRVDARRVDMPHARYGTMMREGEGEGVLKRGVKSGDHTRQYLMTLNLIDMLLEMCGRHSDEQDRGFSAGCRG